MRQHQKRVHPESFNTELLSQAPVPESHIFEVIAEIEAQIPPNAPKNAAFIQTMMDATGLTYHQIRHRREKAVYRTYLEMAKSKLQQLHPSPANHEGRTETQPPFSLSTEATGNDEPQPQASTSSEGLRSPSTPILTRSSRRLRINPSKPPDVLMATQELEPTTPRMAAPTPPDETVIENITPSSPSISDAGPPQQTLPIHEDPSDLSSSNPNLNTTEPQAHQQAEPSEPYLTNGAPFIFSVSDVEEITIENEELTPTQPEEPFSVPTSPTAASSIQDHFSPMANTNNVHPIPHDPLRDHLNNLWDGSDPRQIANRDDFLRMASCEDNSDQLTYLMDNWIEKNIHVPKGRGSNRFRNNPPAGRNMNDNNIEGSGNYNSSHSGRGIRAALFKKTQDLFQKSRATLADYILKGRDLMRPDKTPTTSEFEAHLTASIGTPSTSHLPPPSNSQRPFTILDPITPEEIAKAKLNWKQASAGLDGISVSSIKSMDNKILSGLFTLIVSKRSNPSCFNKAKTIFIYKKGNREDVTNYRPITIGSALQRLLHRILANRINSAIPTHTQQRGFKTMDGTLANTIILNSYLAQRRNKGHSYNVISLDVKQAFDTVAHSAIYHSLLSAGLDITSADYIINTIKSSTTTIRGHEGWSRPIPIKKGVRQGDPLSPTLFNIVIDGLIRELNNNPQLGGTLASLTKLSALAFADDLVILEDREEMIPILLARVQSYFQARGMALNAGKCNIISAVRVNGVSVVRDTTRFKINGEPINAVEFDPFTYLGHEVAATGYLKPSLPNLKSWLHNLHRACLKPSQKLEILRHHLVPRLYYGLQSPKVDGSILSAADRLIKAAVKKMLHLNIHTPDAALHASVRDGGLGIIELRHALPQTFSKRLKNLRPSEDDAPLTASLQSESTTKLISRIDRLAGETPVSQIWRESLSNAPTLQGLENAYEDPASREWLRRKPTGWTGRDFVRAVQLQTNNLPTKGIMSNPPEERRCRGGCDKVESISHVLQQCPATHWERIDRHNAIVNRIARHTREKGWTTEVEPHVRHVDGTLYKPDLAIHKAGEVIISDVSVNWEGRISLGQSYTAKRAVYNHQKFFEAARNRWPDATITVLPIIIGARGIWPRANRDTEEALQLTHVTKTACVNLAIRWAATIHTAFGKRVWSRGAQNNRRGPR